MRRALAIAAVAFLAALGLWAGSLLLAPGERDERAAAPGGQGAAVSAEEELALLLEGVTPVGYGPTSEGVEILRAGAGARLLLPAGPEIALAPPEGVALEDRFVVLGPQTGGFLLAETGAEAAGPFYVSWAHAGQRMEPEDPDAAAALYLKVADRVREAGRLPFLDGTLAVVRVRARPDGVVYCLERADGFRFQGATRFDGAVSLTAMRAGVCAEDPAAVERRLRLAAETVAADG